jgi:hypothetical protein
MARQQLSRQFQSGPRAGARPTPAALPDLNSGQYPFDVVLRLLDQAAYFNTFSIPDTKYSDVGIRAPGHPNGIIGIGVRELLHRFCVNVQPPTKGILRPANLVGEPVGTFSHRWMMIPEGYQALPDQEPPPTPLDSSRSQRFAMLGGICRFGGGDSGLRGFGTGRTYPMRVSGRPRLLAAAVGNIMEGFGQFRGHEGTYIYCGILAPEFGFVGNLLCRVVDPQGDLRTDGTIMALQPRPKPESGLTYILFRGEKKDSNQLTNYTFKPDGQVEGFKLEQQLRLVHLDFASRGTEGLRSVAQVGQVIGKMTSQVFLNILAPGAPGTGRAPIPFHSHNEYTFLDNKGRAIGSFTAKGGEGRTFNMQLAGAPGQQALRFGAFQTLGNGSGQLQGIEGILTDNSVVGVAPHATSTLYMLCINDPGGKYSAAMGAAQR